MSQFISFSEHMESFLPSFPLAPTLMISKSFSSLFFVNVTSHFREQDLNKLECLYSILYLPFRISYSLFLFPQFSNSAFPVLRSNSLFSVFYSLVTISYFLFPIPQFPI